MKHVEIIITTLLAAIALLTPLRAADWLQQGGPNRDGIIPSGTAGKLVSSFQDKTIPLLWSTNVGAGTAPVVISGGRLYTFGFYKLGTGAANLAERSSSPTADDFNRLLRKGKDGLLPGERMLAQHDIPGTPDWVITQTNNYPADLYQGDEYAQCLDASTGKMIWATKLSDYGIGYQANQPCAELASPAIADGKIVFHSPTGHLYCLSLTDGKMLWEVNLWEHEMYDWAEKMVDGCGPLIIGDTVMVSYRGMSDADYQLCIHATKQIHIHGMIPILGGFDLQTGKRKWICKPKINECCFRTNNGRIGFAVIEHNPTVLVSLGRGTYGVDPATGAKRWEYDVPDDIGNNIDGVVSTGIWAPYASYAPVAWNNYVIDSMNNAHDDLDSHSWCLQIIDNKPKVVWETNQFVPYNDCEKSNLMIRDGKLYGSDAHGVWDAQRREMEKNGKPMQPGRAKRPKEIGQFQCRDVATGKLLWSTDAMLEKLAPNDWRAANGDTTAEWYSTKSIMTGDVMIACNASGLWVARLKEDGLDILARNPMQLSAGFSSEPVLVGGLLYVRNFDSRTTPNLSCYDMRAKEDTVTK